MQAVIRRGGKVRALGTRHSFTDLPDTSGVLVSLTGIDSEPVLDVRSHTVRAPAGMRYGDLAQWLDQRGWALHNLGSLPHISIAGAIATGTHGSGAANGNLGTAVRALQYVSATGDLQLVADTDADFEGMVVALGAYGVVIGVTLAVQQTYRVRQDVYAALPWDTILANLEAVMSAGYSVSVFTRWSGERAGDVWVKNVVADDAEAVPRALFGAAADRTPLPAATNLTPRHVAGPWHERLPHFRLDATPSHGDEIQSEYFVDVADGPAALSAIREIADRIEPLLLVSELRAVAPDELWLSGAYRRPSLAIHFTWRNDPVGVGRVLPDIEAALSDFAARPHWGKLHGLDREQLTRVVPRLADARDLYQRLDPDGIFSNHHLERLGVRDPDKGAMRPRVR